MALLVLEARTAYSVNMKGRPPNTPDRFGDDAKAAFLVALERSGEYKAACAVVSVSYDCVYNHRRRFPEFQAACEAALGRQYDKLLAVASKLATGTFVEETLDKNGKVISTRKRWSERVLIAMLRRRDVAAWSDKVQVDSKATVEIHDKRIKTEDMTRVQTRAARDFLKTLLPDDPVRN